MDHRSEDNELVRSDSSPSTEEGSSEKSTSPVNHGDVGNNVAEEGKGDIEIGDETFDGENGEDDADLPQCKIKRNYSCNLCPFFSQNPRSYLYHSRDVHFDRIKIYECSQCLYASKHSQKLQRHINMIHMAGKTRKSRNRMMRPDRKELRPIRPKPPNLSPEEPLKVFSLLTDEQKLKVETDHSDEPEKTSNGEFKCSACNFKHKNPKLLRRHERLVHLKKRYLKCNKCSYVTHVTARFTKHVKYHSMPMIKCDLCDFRTPYKWNLDRHYKNHSGSGAFQCAKCNFRADIKQSLTVHEMNHHVPPVGQGAAIARKKNKVGSSEVQNADCSEMNDEDMPVLKLEKEDSDFEITKEVDSTEEQKNEEVPNLQNLRNVKPPHSNKREAANNNPFQTDFIHPDDVVPRYGQIFVKNLKCKFCSYKAVFSHEIWRHEKRIHGYVRLENKKDVPSKRPPPQLIPIQNKPNPNAILKIPSVRNKSALPSPESAPPEKPVNETEFNEMCKKSSLTSSLKDFVSLIGDEEGLKTIPDSSREDLEGACSGWASESAENSENKNGDLAKQKQTDLLKKKNASFFDKLKENLLTGNNEAQSLFCDVCGHESKCLSEAVAHQKKHSDANFKENSEGHTENDVALSGSGLSSTRCQHCRQRCKTSIDLINHLKYCKAFEASLDSQSNSNDVDDIVIKTEETLLESDTEIKIEEDSSSMENRVFVWNDMSQARDEEEKEEKEEQEQEELEQEEQEQEEQEQEEQEQEEEEEEQEQEEKEEEEVKEMVVDRSRKKKKSIVTSPGYGTVTSRTSDNAESGTLVMKADPRLNVTVKKVFKCPHCSFWASTASRFHVHIVGHLNKKPFECSLCLYRSNWRWDITKHIRLKSLRDPTHSDAKVNMTDETGRRNYSKYNRFLTMMKVQEPTAESSGYGRRSRNGDLTQGTATDKDIIPFPSPPRLTRAPAPKASQQAPQNVPLRPPPPLKAAHQISTQSSLPKQSKESVKKTFWKCKKCNFRDSQKGRVLLHVKKHYMSRRNENGLGPNTSNSVNDDSSAASGDQPDSNSEVKTLLKSPSYSCGHCHQVSNWKHVIQRHCKLKHNGDALIEINWKDGDQSNLEDNQNDPYENFSCDVCPFTTDSEGDLTAHKLNHIDRPGSIFKCTYCPFYVPSKIAVLEHMEVHGVFEGSDLSSLKIDNFEPDEEFIPENCGSPGEASKRYKCLQCPYISSSRTQFLYHKQFHRPRNSPFKCLYCSYNVSRRHLLHQHLRVHHNYEKRTGIRIDRPETPDESETTEEKNQSEKSAEKETTEKPKEKPKPKEAFGLEILKVPLVWVLKAGNFHKMYKCRWCPHVNNRKINILDHEKMHQPSENKAQNDAYKFECSECNYACYNAGVLAAHIKVHQGSGGEIRCFVDPDRPESEQIQELLKSLKSNKPEEVDDGNKLEEKAKEGEPLTSQPENAYSRTNRVESTEGNEDSKKILSFCDKCPARFFYKKELRIHSKFHMIHLPFRCSYCSYSARQRPHLLSHYKIHSQEYRDKTRELMEKYTVSPENPQLKTVIISKGSYVTEGPVWVIKSWENKSELKTRPKYACHLCPATFFKINALQYHLSLHGGSFKFKCKYCNYSVKTSGNLSKHLIIHEKQSKEKRSKKAKFSYSFHISGKDLIQSPEEKESLRDEKTEKLNQTDSERENVMDDSSKSSFSTNVAGSKMKQNKYKCPKCPTVFSKAPQYRIHLSLHGSKHKYQCEKCDYSVKFYPIFVQHQKKHANHDEALKTKKLNDASEKGTVESSFKNASEKGTVESSFKNASEKGTVESSFKNASEKGTVESSFKNASEKGTVESSFKNASEKGTVESSFKNASEKGTVESSFKNASEKGAVESSFKSASEKGAVESSFKNANEKGAVESSFNNASEKGAVESSFNNASEKGAVESSFNNASEKGAVESSFKSASEKGAVESSLKSASEKNAVESSLKNGSDDKKSQEPPLMKKQTLLPQEKKKSLENKVEDRKTYFCGYCPYSSNRRDAIESHSWRHYLVSGVKSNFECGHCDYSATQSNYLQDHIKLHFNVVSRHKAEAYLKCEKMELWCCEKDAKDPRQILIFQDRGDESKPDRYFPPLEQYEPDRDDNVDKKTSGSKKTQESTNRVNKVSSLQNNKLVEMVEEEVEEVPVEKAKPKRCRGKNWRCKKCPHAFGKKDQYLRHVSLHGSNQRHQCDICDYSVKFYTNYVQHMRMHQTHEPGRTIHVKKNFQSLMESAQRLLAESLVEEVTEDFPCKDQKENDESECGFESYDENEDNNDGDEGDDDAGSSCEENLIIDESDEKENNSSSDDN